MPELTVGDDNKQSIMLQATASKGVWRVGMILLAWTAEFYRICWVAAALMADLGPIQGRSRTGPMHCARPTAAPFSSLRSVATPADPPADTCCRGEATDTGLDYCRARSGAEKKATSHSIARRYALLALSWSVV